jgi:hypothetical protein
MGCSFARAERRNELKPSKGTATASGLPSDFCNQMPGRALPSACHTGCTEKTTVGATKIVGTGTFHTGGHTRMTDPLAASWHGLGFDPAGRGVMTDTSRQTAQPPSPIASDRRDLWKLAGLTCELGALLLVIYYFQLESVGFFRVAAIAFGGFVVHYLLPRRHRLPFFLLLSLAAIGVLFKWQAAWLVGLGLTLLGVCHLPVRFGVRVIILLVLAVLLAALRGGWATAPWSPAIWPILASMFMFRLILYLYELRSETAPAPVWQRLSYFFLLPNVCFPMFPVVDYKTFRRSYYNDERHEIYQVGVEWILRGLVQLVLYRLVYYYMSMAPTEVQDLGDLGRYVVSGFLLYLRISGQFHIIVGMLRLFGFNLPETHHLYFLSTSFTDFWRRINIYWKDFMMKIVFYPAYFSLRKRGETAALLWSTALVFGATWVLHAYQWFWIRGTYLLAWTDILFWTILAILVMVNTLYETRYGRDRLAAGRSWTIGRAAGVVVRTAGTFVTIAILWSLWTSASVGEWIALWRTALSNPSVGDARLIPAAVVGLAGFGAVTLSFAVRERARLRGPKPAFGSSVSLALATTAALLALGTPELYARYLPGRIVPTYVAVVGSAREVRLSGHDADLLERGYYEDLLSVQSFNTQLWEVFASWPASWSRLEDTGALRLTGDFLKQELMPSKEIHFRNATLRTNRWGMRDKDYERQPPDGTYRFALVGSSHVMGYGVDDDETFDALVEDRLNAGAAATSVRAFEILNFAVDGYTPLQELVQLDTRVLDFGPHAVLYVAHYGAGYRASLHLLDMAQQGVALPYPELNDILARAGIDRATTRFEGEQRIARVRDELIAWTYRKIVATCRARGVLPMWVYLPQPGDSVSPEGLARFTGIAEDAGFAILSLAEAFKGYDVLDVSFGEWDHHPNALGHRLIADELYRKLQNESASIFSARGAEAPAQETARP